MKKGLLTGAVFGLGFGLLQPSASAEEKWSEKCTNYEPLVSNQNQSF
ncbi:hypothetical protein ACFVR2_25035 [Gottfriedia sp. NPDC057991]